MILHTHPETPGYESGHRLRRGEFCPFFEPDSKRNVPTIATLTLDEAQRRLPDAVEKALKGEEVAITVGRETVRLVHDVPMRPPGCFAECYRDAEDASFEERVCRNSKPGCDWKWRSTVAQISNLPYRRISFGKAFKNLGALDFPGYGGLEIRDTADWESALLACG